MSKILRFDIAWEQRGPMIAQHTLQSCPYRQGEKGVVGLGSVNCRECPHCVERILNDNDGTVECDFDVLDLSLTYHWYDEIESGRKCEEYRELTYYWYKRLLDPKGTERLNRLEDAKCFRKYDAVRFHRGQGGKQTMLFECKEIHIGYGAPWLGAPEERKVFIIPLGHRLN